MTTILRTVQQLRDQVARWRGQGDTIALVPTMGALHAGHLALVEAAKQQASRTVVSIFVNPAQFAPHEDFDRYPRQERADVEKLESTGTGLVYIPSREEMYAEGFATSVRVSGVSEGLCAVTRPHFFDGVALVVAKLLLQCLPEVAVFGEKDYQQLQVIKRLVRDLDIPTEIIGVPTVREPDGLALSSRNQYLDKRQRLLAPELYNTLQWAAQAVKNGQAVDETLVRATQRLLDGGFDKVDYLELREAERLQPLSVLDRPARLLAAAYLGTTRLIDNIAVEP